jgi:hypothetical protein
MIKVNTVRIKLDDNGKGSIVIVSADGEVELPLAATIGVHLIGRSNIMTQVTIRMLANVEFEGPVELTFEQALDMWPEYQRPLNG